jgi:hypothetical protein
MVWYYPKVQAPFGGGHLGIYPLQVKGDYYTASNDLHSILDLEVLTNNEFNVISDT